MSGKAAEEFPATWAGGHALIIEFGDEELLARCQCEYPLGTGRPSSGLDLFARPWESHVMRLGVPDAPAPVRPSDGPPGAGQRHPGVTGRRMP